MADDFTARKIKWMEKVARDDRLAPSATRVAVILSSYVNRTKGYAWPSIPRLATELGMSRRGIQKTLESLIERGHLARLLGGGRASTNHYEMRFSDDKGRTGVRLNDANQRTGVHGLEVERANRRSDKGRTGVRPIPFTETNEKEEESLSESFNEFWNQFPRKVGKKTAAKAFRKAIKEGTDPKEIIAGAMRYGVERDGQPPRFTKHPASWLSGEHWTDEPTPPPSPQGRQKLSASEFAQRRAEAIENGNWK